MNIYKERENERGWREEEGRFQDLLSIIIMGDDNNSYV